MTSQQVVAGRVPGTEQWIVMLGNRSYSLGQALQMIRAQPTAAGRRSGLAALRQQVVADQAGIEQAVVGTGGAVVRQHWHVNAMVVELAPAAVAAVRALPRVAEVVPVRSYPLADAETAAAAAPHTTWLAPIHRSTDPFNHNVAAAWAVLGGGQGMPPYRGAGARIAVFDSGIEADINGSNGSQIDPHPSFLGNAGVTRIEAHLRAHPIGVLKHADVNIIQSAGSLPYVGLAGPHGWRSHRHSEMAAHGNAMAAIAAGRPALGASGTGHAPDATLLDVACTSYKNNDARDDWEVSDANVLAAIEVLREHILEVRADGSPYSVHVANLSFHGDPSPTSPVGKAIDALARQEDILVVASGGNKSDSTESSLGYYHGLAVGSVHARHPGDVGQGVPPNFAFVPMLLSSRGPHASDPRRFYPDVCATGAGPGTVTQGVRRFLYPRDYSDPEAQGSCLLMPGIDIQDYWASQPANNVSPVRYNLGTSQACAQVAGAAALYRGRVPTASAEETRAAILLNVLGAFVSASGQTADPSLQHTYTNRNTFGVGYVRDDLLAQFAVRDPSISPLVQTVVLTSGTPVAMVTHTVPSGARCGVVACWRRNATEEDVPEELDLPNVDLEVVHGGNVLARSATPANSYERLAYVAPTGSGLVAVSYRIRIDGPVPQSVAVQVVAREFATDVDPATSVLDPIHAATGQLHSASAGAGCTATAKDWSVARIVPTAYANAYGSAAFAIIDETGSNPDWYRHLGYDRGFDLTKGRTANYPQPNPDYAVHVGIGALQVGGAIDIAGLAFRTWVPFAPSADATVTVKAWVGSYNPTTTIPVGAVTVANAVAVQAPGSAAGAADRSAFVALLPFDAPFYYGGGGDLNFWFCVSSTAAPFVVDGTADGVNTQYSSTVKSWDPLLGVQTLTSPGHVPILGLVQSSALVAREPRLDVFMEPWSSQSTTGLDLDWRLSGSPANAIWMLAVGGWSATPIASPPCDAWLVGPQVIAVGVSSGHGLASGQFPVAPHSVHLDFGVQVYLATTLFSNAVRVTVGGGV